LTILSSTTKRSPQPHNDKLLIGSQQFLISVKYLPRLFFSLILINWTFRTAVCFPYLLLVMLLFAPWNNFKRGYSIYVDNNHATLPYDKHPHKDVLNDCESRIYR